MTACTSCGVELQTPLVCGACGALQDPGTEPAPHEVFGLDPSFHVDVKDVEKRLMKLSRALHPDFFAGADEATRELAERNTARANAAFELLTDPVALADWWILELGGPAEKDERQMPPAFLMEVIEWNEAIDDADGSDDRASRLAPLSNELESQRASVLDTVVRAFDSLPHPPSDLVAVRRQLNVIRYLNRALACIRGEVNAL